MIKKILITGGNGYLGARFSVFLADKGYEVTPLCFPEIPQNESWRDKMAAILCGDIRDEDFIKKISANAYDAIVHLVSLDHHHSNKNPSFVSSINITPTWSLLEIFSKVGLKKFLYFSTAQVYGKISPEIITENVIPKPVNIYAFTHFLGEQFCNYYNRNSQISCHVVRLSNSYGAPVLAENNCWWLVVNDLCRMAYIEQKIVLQSDGSPQRDFIHGWDVAKAVEIILNHSDQMIYNVCSGTTLTIMEIAFQIKYIYQFRYGKTINIFTPLGKIDSPLSTGIIPKYMLDHSALKKLGYTFEWDLHRGINDLFDFLERYS